MMVGNKVNEYLDVNDDWCEINEKHPEMENAIFRLMLLLLTKLLLFP